MSKWRDIWTDASEPPPPDRCDCIVRLDDYSERMGCACYDVNGKFEGWKFECRMNPDEDKRRVEAWRWQ